MHIKDLIYGQNIIIIVLKISNAKGQDTDGTFLVRDQTGSDVDFALSFLHNSQCYHFFIKRVKEIWFCFDGGPSKPGNTFLFIDFIESYFDYYCWTANDHIPKVKDII